MRWTPTRRREDRPAGDAEAGAAAAEPDAAEQDAAEPYAAEPDDATTDEFALARSAPGTVAPQRRRRRPLYYRLLRLRHISPDPWQRAAVADAPFAVAAVLVLADLASAWTLLALPVAVAVVVKSHDLLAGVLKRPAAAPALAPPEQTADPRTSTRR